MGSLTNAPFGFWGTRTKGFVPVIATNGFLVDSSTENLLGPMSDICDFIHNTWLPRQPSRVPKENTVEEVSTSSEVILIHCYRGKSRSAPIAVAYLMLKYRWPQKKTLEMAKETRKILQLQRL
jgi:hypothetical protein